jgi:hypothetical protein
MSQASGVKKKKTGTIVKVLNSGAAQGQATLITALSFTAHP